MHIAQPYYIKCVRHDGTFKVFTNTDRFNNTYLRYLWMFVRQFVYLHTHTCIRHVHIGEQLLYKYT